MSRYNKIIRKGQNSKRLFKLYTETQDQTLERAVKYLLRFGTSSYSSEIIDKLLLDKGIDLNNVN